MKKRAVLPLSHLRKDLFRVFNLLKAGGRINISYHRKIYVVTIEPTPEKVTTPYKLKKRIPLQAVSHDKCPACQDLMINGIHMSLKSSGFGCPGKLSE